MANDGELVYAAMAAMARATGRSGMHTR